MEEHIPDNAGTGEAGPTDSRGQFIAPIVDLSARLPQHDVLPQSLELMSEEEFWNHARERAKSISSTPPLAPMRPANDAAMGYDPAAGGGSPAEGDHKGRPYAHQYLECRLNCGAFLIPLHALCEVIQAPQLFALLPNIPGWMLGITLWQGRAIAIVDLNEYLCDTTGRTGVSPSEGTLLVANDADLTVGLFVHPTALIDNQVYGEQNIPALPIIEMPMLLADVVRKIGIAAHHG